MNKNNLIRVLLIGSLVLGGFAIIPGANASAVAVPSHFTINAGNLPGNPSVTDDTTQVVGNHIFTAHTATNSGGPAVLDHSSNNGTTWNNLINDGAFYYIEMDASNASKLFIAETTNAFPSVVTLKSSTNNGTSFTTLGNIPDTAAFHSPSQGCIINKDNLNLTIVVRAINASFQDLVAIYHSSDGGSTFGAGSVLYQTDSSSMGFDYLDCSPHDGLGKMAVVFNHYNVSGNTNDTLAVVYTSDYGATWSAVNNFDSYGNNQRAFVTGRYSIPLYVGSNIYECADVDRDGNSNTTLFAPELHIYKFNTSTFAGAHIILRSEALNSTRRDIGCGIYKTGNNLIIQSSGYNTTPDLFFDVLADDASLTLLDFGTSSLNAYAPGGWMFTMPNGNLAMIAGNNTGYTNANSVLEQYNLTVGALASVVSPTSNSMALSNTPIELDLGNEYNPAVFAIDNGAITAFNNVADNGKLYKFDNSLNALNNVQYCAAYYNAKVRAGFAHTLDNNMIVPCRQFDINFGKADTQIKFNDSLVQKQVSTGLPIFYADNVTDASDSNHICQIDGSPDNVAYFYNFTSNSGIGNTAGTYSPSSPPESCYVDKFTNNLLIASNSRISVYSPTGAQLSTLAVSNLPLSIAGYKNEIYVDALTGLFNSTSQITHYSLVNGVITFVAQINETQDTSNRIYNIYTSIDGQYLLHWGGYNIANNVVRLYNTSNLSLNVISPISAATNLIDCKIDNANNAIFCLDQAGKIWKTKVFGYTSSTGGTGNATNDTPNPPPLPDTLPTVNSTTTSTGSSTVVIGNGGAGGGYVGNATTFFGFNISYLATQFGISVTAVQWLLGILVVALVVYGFRSNSPLLLCVAILLGIGLAVVFGLFPVWLLLVLILLLCLLVGKVLFGGDTSDADGP